MADQLRWWKLWCSVMTDAKLRALPLDDVARWCLLGTYIRQHGAAGTVVSPTPHGALADLWRISHRGGRRSSRVDAAERVRDTLCRLPGVDIQDVPGGLRITMRNWHKYQEDSSRERTRRWRENQRQRDGQQTVTRDGHPASPVTEQTRRDETVPPISPTSQHRDQQPRPTYAGATAPPAAWRHDCPVLTWRGRCVDRTWAAAHPDVSMPVVPDGRGGYVVRECPTHRAQP